MQNEILKTEVVYSRMMASNACKTDDNRSGSNMHSPFYTKLPISNQYFVMCLLCTDIFSWEEHIFIMPFYCKKEITNL